MYNSKFFFNVNFFKFCNFIHCKSSSKHDKVKILQKSYQNQKYIGVNNSEINCKKFLNKMESEEGKRNNLKAAKTTFQKLKTEWAKRPPNLDLCGQLLADLKVNSTYLFIFKLFTFGNINLLIS